jgi:hypothetical protein
VLAATSLPELVDLQLLFAAPEWLVDLPGGSTRSATDVLALCRNATGLCVVAVEAKVLEAFGPTVAEKRAEASPGQEARLKYLCALLGVAEFSGGIRYQLLHRAASALLIARDFHAPTSVMLVQAFDTPSDRKADFDAFGLALGATQVSPSVYRVPRSDSPSLYLAWCTGDAGFREVVLPGAA